MKKTVLALVACVPLVLMPATAFAWGAQAHQLIMRRAIELLPPELKPFYEYYREELVLRSNDPDLWRNVPWDDDANHFINFGVPEYGKPPFDALPREFGAAQAKFGAATLKRLGTLPWRIEEMAGSLQRGFDGMSRKALYSISDVVLFSAVTGHYIQDATQPFHTTDNYDGFKTGNAGIHSRFERDLVEKFASRLKLAPAPPKVVASPRDLAFETVIASYGVVDQVLAADKAALGTKDAYDDEYFEKFFTAVQPLLEQQLSAAITSTASLILTAWDHGGRPPMYTAQPRPTQRLRR